MERPSCPGKQRRCQDRDGPTRRCSPASASVSCTAVSAAHNGRRSHFRAAARRIAVDSGSDVSDAPRCPVAITLDRKRMASTQRSGTTGHLPTPPTVIHDVGGAGDAVLAALTVTMITGKSLREACRAAMGRRESRGGRWDLQPSRASRRRRRIEPDAMTLLPSHRAS